MVLWGLSKNLRKSLPIGQGKNFRAGYHAYYHVGCLTKKKKKNEMIP